MNDIKNYAPLVKKGGILCGHDCEGRIKDYDAEFLAAGKEVDYMESVHCGVVLAVNSVFNDFSLNHSIWSVKSLLDGGKWTPTDVEFRGLNDKGNSLPLHRFYAELHTASLRFFCLRPASQRCKLRHYRKTVRDAEGV